MSDEKPGREDDARDAELTDEQLDRETPGSTTPRSSRRPRTRSPPRPRPTRTRSWPRRRAVGGAGSPPTTTRTTTTSRSPRARRAARSAPPGRPRGRGHPLPRRRRAGPRRRRPAEALARPVPPRGRRRAAQGHLARPPGADHLHDGGHRLRGVHRRAGGRPGPALRQGRDRRLRLIPRPACTLHDKEETPVTDPREPFETDSPVEGARPPPTSTTPGSSERGAADLETGAGETGAAEGSSDTADLDTATEVADVDAEIEDGDTDRRRADPLAAPAADLRRRGEEDKDPAEAMKKALRIAPGDWYVVHSYAGYENKVKTNLEARIQSLDVEDYIYQIEVPTEEVTEIKNGKRAQVNRKVLPATCWCAWSSTTSRGARCATPPASPASWARRRKSSPLTLDEVVKILVPATRRRPLVPPAARPPGRGRRAGRRRRLRGRRVGHRHGRAVRHAPGHDQRDQRRAAEAAGARLDLRPRDAGRVVVQPGPEVEGVSTLASRGP